MFVCEPITLDTGCWEYSGTINSDGYGQVMISRKHHKTHRLVYQHFIKEIPIGLELDHLCRNRKCSNPSHLEVVDGVTNTLRGESFSSMNRKKTQCPQGHSYDEDNTRIGVKGDRRCKLCEKEYDRQRYLRKKERLKNGRNEKQEESVRW